MACFQRKPLYKSATCQPESKSEDFPVFQDANGEPAASSSWAEEFHGRQDSPAGWADQFHEQMHPPDAWADQFEAQNGAEQWVEDFAASRDQGLAQGLGAGDQEYVMAVDNPFLSVGILLAKPSWTQIIELHDQVKGKSL